MSSTASPSDGLARTVSGNLRALVDHRCRAEREQSRQDRIAELIARWAGSMYFAYAHAIVVAFWIVWNSIPGLPHWDPYPFVMLAMAASVEAIFLSTFVLISQNRMGRLADQRADLDVQVNLLSEREITRVLELVSRIADRVGVHDQPADVADLQRDIDPRELLERIEAAEAERGTVEEAECETRADARVPRSHRSRLRRR